MSATVGRILGTVIARGYECPAVMYEGRVKYKSPITGKVLLANFAVARTFIRKGKDREFNFEEYPAVPVDLGIVRGTVIYRGKKCPAVRLRTGQIFYARPMTKTINMQVSSGSKTYHTFEEYPNREELRIS